MDKFARARAPGDDGVVKGTVVVHENGGHKIILELVFDNVLGVFMVDVKITHLTKILGCKRLPNK